MIVQCLYTHPSNFLAAIVINNVWPLTCILCMDSRKQGLIFIVFLNCPIKMFLLVANKTALVPYKVILTSCVTNRKKILMNFGSFP